MLNFYSAVDYQIMQDEIRKILYNALQYLKTPIFIYTLREKLVIKTTPFSSIIRKIIVSQQSFQYIIYRKKQSIMDQSDSSVSFTLPQNLQKQALYSAEENMQLFIVHVNQNNSPINPSFLHMDSKIKVNLSKSTQEISKQVRERIQKILKNKKQKKNWRAEDMEILCWTVSHYCALHSKTSVQSLDLGDWQRISNCIPGATARQCMFKILGLRIVRLSECHFSQHENMILKQLVSVPISTKSIKWRKISEELYLRNQEKQRIFRTSKQCKQHWFSFLSSESKKGPWSSKEDRKLMAEVQKHNGIGRWAQIARNFEGRSDNAIKNRFCLLIKQLKQKYKTENTLLIISKYLKSGKNNKTISNRELPQEKFTFEQKLVLEEVKVQQGSDGITNENDLGQKQVKKQIDDIDQNIKIEEGETIKKEEPYGQSIIYSFVAAPVISFWQRESVKIEYNNL